MNTPLGLRLLRKFFKPKSKQWTVLKIVQVLGFADFLRNDSLLDLDCAPVWELTRMLLKQVVDHQLQKLFYLLWLADTQILFVSTFEEVLDKHALDFTVVPQVPD